MRHKPRDQYVQQLQHKLGYHFKHSHWLNQALTHRSHSADNYERLEFIGDSILDYVIAKMLYDAFPKLPEGRLSPLRAQLVREATLAEIARELGLGQALLLGAGESKSGGHDRASILADALEALFAAISLDSDFAVAQQVIVRLFAPRIANVNTEITAKDNKTQLQEMLQAHRLALPKYRIEQQTGEGSDAWFKVSCDLGELGHITYAQASSRRLAEQECAKQAVLWLAERLK
ncbi:MAG: ribonuclease III [Alysiella sp.]|uniref:ribonuclease III n=1 Tax=Alysiella sp. TaxID=1872483 RepID=UPI0026DC5FD7|nr:ribonuclease III [Alysiella sp.]MDO4433295.1 ribonuclease III [Alysiella sp.]